MSTGVLFITAKNADFKDVNRVLLDLRDWEYGHEDSWDGFHLVPSREGLNLIVEPPSQNARPTVPPLPEMNYDAWKGATISDVEAFMLRQAKDSPTIAVNQNVFIVVDDQGLKDGTCVLGERIFDDEKLERDGTGKGTDDDYHLDKFNKVRMPQNEANAMFSNLDISNMDFEDYCDEDAGADEEGWWKHQSVADGPDLSERNARKKRETLEQLDREGKV